MKSLGLFTAVACVFTLTGRLPAQATPDLAAETRAAMAKAVTYVQSISEEGGYLWRYSADLQRRAGEEVATPTQIWVQPPGTPAVGTTLLRAYAATGDARYLEGARAAADALARGQLQSGGWDYLIEFNPALRARHAYRADAGKTAATTSGPASRNRSTFDDNNTQSALRFLLAFVDAAAAGPADPRDARIREARDYGLKKLIEAQYPIGAWPQRWDGEAHDPKVYPILDATIPKEYPREQPSTPYYGFYTLNDNTQRDCIETLLDAHKRTGESVYLEAARRGADFLMRAQLPQPQPGWAQQYNPAMEPAWARAFEPPCVTASEGAQALNLLLDMYLQFGDEKYIRRVPEAIAWFRRSEVSPGVWNRMYELTTNRPIFGDRDKRIHYTLEELSEERRTGYSWRGSYGIPGILERAEGIMKSGREKWLADHAVKPLTPAQKAARASALEPRVKAVIADLDAEGRWLSANASRPFANDRGPWVEMNRFNQNMNMLCEYLEMTGN
jgi:hypothetical protein